MSKYITSVTKGAAVDAAEDATNINTSAGINQAIAGATHTVDITDQGDTLEFTNGGAVAVTLDSIATILLAAHTSDFQVTLISIGAGTVVTITPNALDSINTGASTIVLSENQYVTIQSDSTEIIWNIIDSPILGLTSSVAELNKLDGATVTTTELNKLSGATVTTAEINNIDGSTSATAITSAGTDRVVYNDGGLMIQVALTTLSAYFRSVAETLTNKTLTSPVINTSMTGTAIGRGAAVYNASNVSIPDGTRTAMSFDTEIYDTDTIHNNTTNNTRLTVPTGVTKVKLVACVIFPEIGTNYRNIVIYKNGASIIGQPQHDLDNNGNTSVRALQVTSPVYIVTAGDYFELMLKQTSGISATTIGGGGTTWFSMEIIK